ncbi:uncharacterized protein [Anomalospiza imberbis]|uniref:uncharacterized protein n=1 Tax=Anomalospiza imberbis TaxID=187417 RepID=UPI00358E81A6
MTQFRHELKNQRSPCPPPPPPDTATCLRPLRGKQKERRPCPGHDRAAAGPSAADLRAAPSRLGAGLGRAGRRLRPAAGAPAPAQAAPLAALTPAALEHLEGRWRLRFGPSHPFPPQGECGKGGLVGLRAGAGRGELVPRLPAPGGRRLPRGQPARGEGGGAAAGPAELVPVGAESTGGPVLSKISEAQDGICPSFCIVSPPAVRLSRHDYCIYPFVPPVHPRWRSARWQRGGKRPLLLGGFRLGCRAEAQVARLRSEPSWDQPAGKGWQGILWSGTLVSRRSRWMCTVNKCLRTFD